MAAPTALATSACCGRMTSEAPGRASPHSAAPPPTTMTGTSSAEEILLVSTVSFQSLQHVPFWLLFAGERYTLFKKIS